MKGCVGLIRKNNGMCMYGMRKIAGKFLTGHVVGLSPPLFAFGLKTQLFQNMEKKIIYLNIHILLKVEEDGPTVLTCAVYMKICFEKLLSFELEVKPFPSKIYLILTIIIIKNFY